LNISSFTGATTVWDWAAIRKCITIEPANSTWGSEETVPPAITGFLPASACQGASGIIITGTNFTGATTVTFNGTPAGFIVDNPTQITAIVPFSATTGVISIATPGGTANSASFTVKESPLAIVTGQTNITCNAANDGTITVTGSGGTEPYYFSDDDGSNYYPSLPAAGNANWTFTGLIPNNPYRIKVKDNIGCISK
jgi:hypothetical protein